MQNKTKTRSLSIFLTIAMLAIAVAAFLPLASSADGPAEIQDFSYQTLSSLDLAGDADTDVRFLFTVGSLAYDEVGFVFSKTNETPTVGGSGCIKKETTSVYSTITANGTPRQASDGRWWVAVKMIDIPHAYFDGMLYVRPYVDDGEIRYGEAKALTVCTAAGHDHAPQLLPGHCDGCNLDDVMSGEPTVLKSSDKSKGTWDIRPTFTSIRGEDHFYNGNDLLMEFSILWNETMESVYGAGSTFDIGVNDGSDLANIDLQSATSGRIAAKERAGTTYIYPTPSAIAADSSVKYPNIGEYGWHRIGVRIHQEAAIVAAEVQYAYVITVYLDGEMILKYDSTEWATSVNGALLFTATIENEQLVYHDNGESAARANFTIVNYYKGSDNYLVIADEHMTCGTDFVQSVVPVYDPADAVVEVDESVEYPAKMWFTLTHEHAAAAEYTIDLAPTCTTPGSKSYHCTICGAIMDETVVAIDPTGDAHTPAAEYTVDLAPTCTALGSRSKHCTLCDAIIPETVESIAVIPHTPAAEYTVDLAPTCSAVGSESKHCTVCGASVVETARAVAIDPDAHNVASWTTTVQPTLLADGERSGECTLCHDTIIEAVAYGGPTIVNSSSKTKGNWDVSRTYKSIRGSKQYYPDASNGYAGNDLLMEFSILWNDTLESVYGSGSTIDIGVWDGYDVANIDLQSATPGVFSAKERAGTTYIYPTPSAIAADASVKHPHVGADGWHRIGIRVHEEAAIVAAAVEYSYIITIYLDGEQILKYDSSAWATDNPDALLYTAEIVDDQLVYTANDSGTSKGSISIANYYKGSNNYLVIADETMTCGTDFVQQVEAVETPAAASIELGGNNYPAAIYYRFED